MQRFVFAFRECKLVKCSSDHRKAVVCMLCTLAEPKVVSTRLGGYSVQTCHLHRHRRRITFTYKDQRGKRHFLTQSPTLELLTAGTADSCHGWCAHPAHARRLRRCPGTRSNTLRNIQHSLVQCFIVGNNIRHRVPAHGRSAAVLDRAGIRGSEQSDWRAYPAAHAAMRRLDRECSKVSTAI